MKSTKLYRPIGAGEYNLIKESGYVAFPPRLEWQPIFYPVTNQKYAEQIANDWNTQDEFSGYCGLVTSFKLSSAYLEKFPIKNVGGPMHDELWVPADELETFNSEIIEEIEIVNAFFGNQFNLADHPALELYYKQFK